MAKTKDYQGCCVDNPFDDIAILCEIVENAIEITKQTFLKHCFIHPDTMQDFRQWPRSYVFSKYKNIYFYTWSAIEHFYY